MSNGAFFNDAVDHELARLRRAPRRRGVFGVSVSAKQLKIQDKIKVTAASQGGAGRFEFCTENKPKTLAFCAARSHIVAVR
jgi:hypothetical protein